MTSEPIEFSDTALLKVRPDTDTSVIAMQTEVAGLLKYAESRVIATDADVKMATEDLSLLAKLKKAIADKRRDWLTPIKEKLDAVDVVFKSLSTPLDQADKFTRSKILAYRQEQERKAREAATQLKKEKDKDARAALEKTIADETLAAHAPTPQVASIVLPTAPKVVRTETVSGYLRMDWTFEVTDETQIPREYLMVNERLIRDKVKAGIRQIPGVRIFEKPTGITRT